MFDLQLYPWLSVIPPLLAIGIAVIFRQVYIALIIGLWSGTVILANGNPVKALADTIDLCIRVFKDADNTRVICFSCLIGGLIAFTQRSGGVKGFIHWLSKHSLINSKKQAQLMTMAIGMCVPIESSISVLVTGTVARPIFDRLKISREKLAYICDSTSAPICALIPVNAWGAYMASLLANQDISNPFGMYIKALLFNFYPILALILMFILIVSQKDFFYMKKAEHRAREKDKVLSKKAATLISSDVMGIEPKQNVVPRASNLILPVFSMIAMMIAGLFVTGNGDLTQGSGSTAVLWAVLTALTVGGIKYLISGIMRFNELMQFFFKGVGGLINMAVLMMLAFAIGNLCRDLKTGIYVAGIAKDLISPSLLPFILFITTSFIAFSTGTSWGTWGIMVPIGIPVAQQLGVPVVPVVASIVSGGVFGDHCSPISDTTIVSSLASASDHIDHVNTQLPYALFAGTGAALMFLLAGILY